MTSPDPSYRDHQSGGSSYYPDQPPQTRAYAASDSESERRAERAEAQREQRRAADREHRRIVAGRTANTIIQVVCYLFAVVLAVHIVLVIGNANQGNGFYQFVDSWANGITLGFDDLFVPENLKFRTLLNEGLAAIVWIIIGIVLSTLVKRLVMPIPRNRQTW